MDTHPVMSKCIKQNLNSINKYYIYVCNGYYYILIYCDSLDYFYYFFYPET